MSAQVTDQQTEAKGTASVQGGNLADNEWNPKFPAGQPNHYGQKLKPARKPIPWNTAYYEENIHSDADYAYESSETEVEDDDGSTAAKFFGFSTPDSEAETEGKGAVWWMKDDSIPVTPREGVTVTVPPLPQLGTVLQSNVRRLGRAEEEALMRWCGLEKGEDVFPETSCGKQSDVEWSAHEILVNLNVTPGDSVEPRKVEKSAKKKGKSKKIKCEIPSFVGIKRLKGFYKGGSLSIVTIRKELKAKTGAGPAIPTIVLGPLPEELNIDQEQKEASAEKRPQIERPKCSFRWGRKILHASPRLRNYAGFEEWYKVNGTEFSQANIRIGFADGLYEYPSSPGYYWITKAMLSDPLILPLQTSLHAVAKRPEFTVDCRWLTENDLFIIIDTLCPGPDDHALTDKICPITHEPLSRRRFRTPNNRPFLPLGGWTGDSGIEDLTKKQRTFVERYFIWVNRDGKIAKEGSARWPPCSARKKSSPIQLNLPKGTPKEQYTVIIGQDDGLDPELRKAGTVPDGLKLLEKHIKVKLEIDKDWLKKMIEAPVYWIVQEIITTLLDGRLKGLLGEARRRVNRERKKALRAEPLAQGVYNLTAELDMMQELVGIMEEYIRFVSGFEAAYHNLVVEENSDSSTFSRSPMTKLKKRGKKKRRGIPPPDKPVRREFMMLRKSLEGYRDALVDIKGDVEYTIQMVFSTASANQSADALDQSQLAHMQAEEMYKQTHQVMVQTDKMTHQAESMRRLTLLALFFLPSNFIATIFGMNVLELKMPSLWVFFAVSVPTTIIIFGATYWYDSKREIPLRPEPALHSRSVKGKDTSQTSTLVGELAPVMNPFGDPGSVRLGPSRYSAHLLKPTVEAHIENVIPIAKTEVQAKMKQIEQIDHAVKHPLTRPPTTPQRVVDSQSLSILAEPEISGGRRISHVSPKSHALQVDQRPCSRNSQFTQLDSPRYIGYLNESDGYCLEQPRTPTKIVDSEAARTPSPSPSKESRLEASNTHIMDETIPAGQARENLDSNTREGSPTNISTTQNFMHLDEIQQPRHISIHARHRSNSFMHGVGGHLQTPGSSRRGSVLFADPPAPVNGGIDLGPERLGGMSFNSLFVEGSAYEPRRRRSSFLDNGAGPDGTNAQYGGRSTSREFERRPSGRLALERERRPSDGFALLGKVYEQGHDNGLDEERKGSKKRLWPAFGRGEEKEKDNHSAEV